MTTSGLYDDSYEDEGLVGFALRSFFAHVAFIALGVLLTASFDFFSFGDISDENIELVEASVRVDVVEMPKMTVKELQALQQQNRPSNPVDVQKAKKESSPVPEVKKVADDSKAPVLEQNKENSQKKTSVSDILNRAASQKGETVTENEQRDEGISNEARERLRSLVAAGNKISKGSSVSGAGNSVEQATAFNSYISQVPELVRPNWRLPSYLIDQDLRCRIRIYLSESGDLTKAEIYESSGNEEYDQRALKAVRQSAPFPPLESSMASRAINGEILLGFPL